MVIDERMMRDDRAAGTQRGELYRPRYHDLVTPRRDREQGNLNKGTPPGRTGKSDDSIHCIRVQSIETKPNWVICLLRPSFLAAYYVQVSMS